MIVLTDIAVTQSSFQSYLGYPRFHPFASSKVSNFRYLQYDERLVSFKNTFQKLGYVNFNLGHRKKAHKFVIEAVATVEHVQSKDVVKESGLLVSSVDESVLEAGGSESNGGDSEDLDERERLRRLRISKANKGNTPWNKGRKHSPETLQRIRERTRLAMQNPKVKMKLANIGHAQSEETREKIAVGVRMGWQRRREKLLLQETCLFDWQNLIAETARKGLKDEEELQWDSYEILSEQLQKEWLDSIEVRKARPRPKGSKRAPKSLEQRRKIAEAIAAKWADPDYRARVSSGLARYHGTPEGAERKPKKRSGESGVTRAPRKKVSESEKSAANGMKVSPQQPKMKRWNAPKYKDPLASYKLEMLKSIRAQRVVTESKKIEALQRARLLIAEAEKAAKALEVAATRSPVAQASLIESRKLIAEAIESIESIDNLNVELVSQDDLASEQRKIEESHKEDSSKLYHNGMNVVMSEQSRLDPIPDFNLYKLSMLDKNDMNNQVPTNLSGYEMPKLDLNNFMGNSDTAEIINPQHTKPNGVVRLNGVSSLNGVQSQSQQDAPAVAKTATKRWVRGRLVEVQEVELNA